jgi:hypothetical protein
LGVCDADGNGSENAAAENRLQGAGVHGEFFRLECSIEICATRMAMHPCTLIVIGLRSDFDPTELARRALERFGAAAFSASLTERETDPFRAGLIHALPTEPASVGSTGLRGQGMDKSGVVTLTK